MEKGFTLVELSIVLVIIGLLIGGILVGQSLVNSARLSNSIRLIQQTDIAVSNFKNKYKELPGDSTYFDVAGDGDGYIRSHIGNWANYTGEIMNFWNHLVNSEMKGFYDHDNGNGVNTPANNRILAGINCAEFKYSTDNACLIAVTSDTGDPNKLWDNGITSYQIRREYDTNGGTHLFQGDAEPNNSTPLTTIEALEIDSKLDDGIANSGDVKASNGERAGLNPEVRNSGCVVSGTPSLYDTASGSSQTHCALSILMFSQTGGN